MSMQWTQSSYNLDNNVNILYNSIIMDNFLISCNIDRLMQSQDIKGQQQWTATDLQHITVLEYLNII